MSPRGAGAVVAGLVFAIGLLLGLLPHSIPGNGVLAPMSCGSAFIPSRSDAASSDLASTMVGVSSNYDQQCGDSLGTPRIAGLGLVGLGLLGLVFLGLTRKRDSSATRPRSLPVPVDRESQLDGQV